MPHKLNIDRNIEPKKSALQEMSDSPVGWWEVTTEGDCEGRSTTKLGIHYGHVAEIALSLRAGYSLRFVLANAGLHPKKNTPYKIIQKTVNVSFDCWSHKGGEKGLAEWLDCPEIRVKPCNYYGAYTLELVD